MIDTFYIGAYWNSKKESLNDVVLKTQQTLETLGKLDKQFENWYELGFSRKKALEKAVLSHPDSIKMLYRKRVKKEIDEFEYPLNFFSLDLWSGHKTNEASSISFNVGGEFNSNYLSNCCVITIPIEGEARERLLKIDKTKEMFNVLVQNWSPDRVVLVSKELKRVLNTVNEVGWVTYAKEIHCNPQKSSMVISEKCSRGYLFYLNLEDDVCYDYSLATELLPVKQAVK